MDNKATTPKLKTTHSRIHDRKENFIVIIDCSKINKFPFSTKS